MAVVSVSPDSNVVTSLSSVRRQRVDVQLRQLEFNALLHRKLDLDALFECLMIEGQGFVSFDGLQFRAAGRGGDILLGDVRQHRQGFELKLGERVLGEVVFMRGSAFDAREERDVERLVESLVYPLDNALAHHAALLASMTDAATGLRNHACLERLLPREMQLARRVERPLSVVLLRVDYLEKLGEHHGSEIGDQARSSVANALTGLLRRSDLVFRTAEDAFCIVLPDTGLDGALTLAGRIRARIGRCVTDDNVRYVLTASGGVTEIGSGDTAAVLLERAAEALGQARRVARDRLRGIPAPADEGSGGDDGPEAA